MEISSFSRKLFCLEKKCIFPFFFEINLVESEILKLHHSLHKTNHLFYIMRFTSSFSLCHLEFHKNMLKQRSICVTSFDFLHWWSKVVQFSLQSYTTCGQWSLGVNLEKGSCSFLVIVVGFSMTPQEQWMWSNS